MTTDRQVDAIKPNRWMHPHQLRPPHGVENRAWFNHLVESMRQHGWRGRPLLILDDSPETNFEIWEYISLTGSHRIAAALEAGIDFIPCFGLRLDETDWTEEDHGYWYEYEYDDLAEWLRSIGAPQEAVDLLDFESEHEDREAFQATPDAVRKVLFDRFGEMLM